jgi:hypothetical protein
MIVDCNDHYAHKAFWAHESLGQPFLNMLLPMHLGLRHHVGLARVAAGLLLQGWRYLVPVPGGTFAKPPVTDTRMLWMASTT